MFPSPGLSGRFPLPPRTEVPFEPGTPICAIGTALLRKPVNALQSGCGEGLQGRQENRGNPSAFGDSIVRPEAATHGARLCALAGVIMIALRRDRHFVLLRDDAVPFPLTLWTAIAGRQGHSNRNSEPMAARTFDFRRARCILILRHIGHLGSATLGAAQCGHMLLVAVDRTR